MVADYIQAEIKERNKGIKDEIKDNNGKHNGWDMKDS